MMTCDSAFSNQRDDANNLFYAESSNNVADIQVIHEIGMFYFEQGPMGHYSLLRDRLLGVWWPPEGWAP